MRTTRPAVAALTLLTVGVALLAGPACRSTGRSIALTATTVLARDDASAAAETSAATDPSSRSLQQEVDVTTTLLDAANSADSAEPADAAGAADLSGMAAAAGRRDPCAVYDELEVLKFDGQSFESIAATMEEVRSLLASSADGVDRSIRQAWSTITAAIGDLATALRSGDDAKEAAAAVLADPDYVDAQHAVERWLGRNCG